MKINYLIILLLLLAVISCKKKKKNMNCEFHRLEFVQLNAQNGNIIEDKSVLECLQLEVKDDLMHITNPSGTINMEFSVSGESVVEEFEIDIDKEVIKSFNAADEQEMELVEKPKSWEISIKSDNNSKFNGYVKLFKTSDGDYWKSLNGNEVSTK